MTAHKQPCVSHPGQVFGYVYVDNLGLESLEEAVQTALRQRVTQTSLARWWRLYRGLGGLLKRKAVSRCRTIFRYVRICLFFPSWLAFDVLVNSVVELFCDLMVYLEPSWRRQWNSMVMSSDTSMTGWSFIGAFWPLEVVSSVGHTSERPRFRRCEGPNGQDHAFRPAFLEPVDPYTENPRLPQEDAPDELWIEDPNFPEMPDQHLRAHALEAEICWEMGTKGRHL